MVTFKSVRGWKRSLFTIRLFAGIAMHYLPRLLSGELSLRRIQLFVRRLIIFAGAIKENKYIKVNGKIRTGLYIPEYPSRAYFTSCDKFLEFDEIPPALTVLISITSACRCRCEHCYQKMDRGKDVDIEKLVSVARKLQDHGMAYFIIEGGEPFLVYDRLIQLMQNIDDRSEIWVNTTGDGLTRDRVREMKALGLTAMQFSFHTPHREELNAFMGNDRAWDNLENGVKLCVEEGVPVSFNMCLMKKMFKDGTFELLMDQIREWKGVILQIIHPKQSGGWLDDDVEIWDEEDFEILRTKVNLYNHHKSYKDFPAISAQIMEEDPELFGCTAGGVDRFYLNAKGDVQPCEFLNISFGNIAEEDFEKIYQRMRHNFQLPGQTWLCSTFTKHISRICKERNIKSLPLDKELSKKIYQNWDRGAPTPLYVKIQNELGD